MSKPLFLCALLMFTALAHAAPNRTIADVAPKQVAPRTYVIHGPLEQPTPGNKAFINNPAFVLTDAGVVVVDPAPASMWVKWYCDRFAA
jgi:hypothetical protein